MQITPAESQIMEALWKQGALPFDDIMEAVAAEQGWARATVKTLVNRLLHKKAIASERAGGRHGYRPLIARADYVHSESKGLLDRLFDGQIETFVTHFSERQDLSANQIETLRRLVERLGDDK